VISTLVRPESLYAMALHQPIFRAKFSLKDLADATAPGRAHYGSYRAAASTVDGFAGQTIDQVVAIVGQPEYEVDLSSKNIYVY
jgi:hypothetical protein